MKFFNRVKKDKLHFSVDINEYFGSDFPKVGITLIHSLNQDIGGHTIKIGRSKFKSNILNYKIKIYFG